MGAHAPVWPGAESHVVVRFPVEVDLVGIGELVAIAGSGVERHKHDLPLLHRTSVEVGVLHNPSSGGDGGVVTDQLLDRADDGRVPPDAVPVGVVGGQVEKRIGQLLTPVSRPAMNIRTHILEDRLRYRLAIDPPGKGGAHEVVGRVLPDDLQEYCEIVVDRVHGRHHVGHVGIAFVE